jgi:hypothetical protein
MTHTGHCHQSKCKLDNKETKNSNTTMTINQMSSTRSGKTNYKVGPEHDRQYAHAIGTFESGNSKRKVDEGLQASTHL